MDHKLRIIVRLDLGQAATLLIASCPTDDTFKALVPIVRRTSSLVFGQAVCVDLSDARHVEASALEKLRGVQYSRQRERNDGAPKVGRITIPPHDPSTPSRFGGMTPAPVPGGWSLAALTPWQRCAGRHASECRRQ